MFVTGIFIGYDVENLQRYNHSVYAMKAATTSHP